MKEQEAIAQHFVQYQEFIVVILAIFGLLVGGFWIMIAMISSVKSRLSLTEQQNRTDIVSVDDLWDAVESNRIKMEEIERQRGKDVLLFTEAIGKLNTTLGKIEVTLENSNQVMEKMDKRLENQDREIDRLKELRK